MKLKSLGKSTNYDFSYNPEILEAFCNKHSRDYFIRLHCPEFTTLCPITKQPDFATLKISYIPDKKIVESKSLKLYLFSFRNHGSFHEDCVNVILDDLVALLKPKYLEVLGEFVSRGGISINPFVNYGKPNSPYQEMAQYRLLNYNLPSKIAK